MTDEKRMQTSLYTGYSNTWEYSGISDIESGAESQQRNRHARTIVGTTGSLSDGTVWSMLIEEERSLHQIWHHVRKINEQAYAAALVDLELVVGHYINSPLDVAAAIRFIESARFFSVTMNGLRFNSQTVRVSANGARSTNEQTSYSTSENNRSR